MTRSWPAAVGASLLVHGGVAAALVLTLGTASSSREAPARPRAAEVLRIGALLPRAGGAGRSPAARAEPDDTAPPSPAGRAPGTVGLPGRASTGSRPPPAGAEGPLSGSGQEPVDARAPASAVGPRDAVPDLAARPPAPAVGAGASELASLTTAPLPTGAAVGPGDASQALPATTLRPTAAAVGPGDASQALPATALRPTAAAVGPGDASQPLPATALRPTAAAAGLAAPELASDATAVGPGDATGGRRAPGGGDGLPAAPGASAGGASPSDRAGDTELGVRDTAADVELTRELHARLAAAATACYPAQARRFRQQGRVPLSFCVTAAAQAERVVVTPSGLAALDEAARSCVVERAAPFPARARARCFNVLIDFGGQASHASSAGTAAAPGG
ncbi:MAG: hypothetical protein IAE78_28575 [Myxococcus sp.]|nr:hypothetical protein [Myxococcus sp.]